jgi:aspartate/methionine/tyrosine aminotransferase
MILPEFRLETFFGAWEFNARYNLSSSDAQTSTLNDLLALAAPEDRERWETLSLGYIQTRGTPALLEAIAGTYDRVTPNDIIAFTGAEEGIFCAMHALLEPDDHAIVLVPNYQSMESVPLSICAVSGVVLHEHDGWRLDIDEVRALLRLNTRLIAVNFPNNPTGAIADRRTFDALIELARGRGIYLFSDEVYRGVERDESKRLPQAADLYERALSLNVVSKVYGLPGLRIGWVACRDRALLDRMERVKHYLSICNSAPSEVLARIGIMARTWMLERTRAICVQNLTKLQVFFSRHTDRFEWYDPDGGCTAYPRYTGSEGVDEFCKRLVEEFGVLLVPASVYRSALLCVPVDRFRIGYGRLGMDEALDAFGKALIRS